MDRLQVVQNTAVRLLTRNTRRSHLTPVLKALHWLPIGFRVNFLILVITYRALHGQAPSYIQALLHAHSPGRSLRSSDIDLLTNLWTRLKTRGDRAFCVVAPRLWNSLPLSLRTMCSVESLKKTPKDIFLDRLLTSNMIWKQFFVISGGICTAGILTFVLILIFDCEALCDSLSVKGAI